MKHNKNLPVYYRTSFANGVIVQRATLIGIEQAMRDNDSTECIIESGQLINKEFVNVEGRARNIINGKHTL